MACTVAEFRTRFPEFSDETMYPDDRVQMFLDDAACYIGTDENYWCGKYNLAQCYLAAHLLRIATLTSVGDTAANAGPITNKSAGGVSVGRTAATRDTGAADDFYMTTKYGQQFIVIRNGCFPGILAVPMNSSLYV